jgi:hypothetical protein
MRPRAALRGIACFILLFCVSVSAQNPLGQIFDKPNPLGSVENTLKQKALEASISKLLNSELPINLNAKALYPTVNSLPGGPFVPQQIAISEATGDQPLAPGDYEVKVTAFCTEYSIHRPGKGVAYQLGPLQGKAAGAVANIIWRGMFAGVTPQQIMGLTWAIQSGITYDQMPQNYKQLIDQLIPDYKSQISSDFVQQVEDSYSQVAKQTKLPPLSQLLGGMGEAGKLMLSAQQQRNALLQQNTSDEIKEQTLFAGQESGVYTPVKVEEGPWTVRIPGVAYMRYQINGGNLASDNVLQIRILPELNKSAAKRTQQAAVVEVSYQPQGSADATSGTNSSLFNLLGVKRTANGVDASGMIGYPTGEGAQDLGVGPTGGGGNCKPDPSYDLSVSLLPQEKDNWCWAAVSEMLMANAPGGKDIPQCTQASTAWQNPQCCPSNNPSFPGTCDRQYPLSNALGNFGYDSVNGGGSWNALSPDAMKQELFCKHRLIAVTWKNDAGSLHDMIVYGYDSNFNEFDLHIFNPGIANGVIQSSGTPGMNCMYSPKCVIPYDDFKSPSPFTLVQINYEIHQKSN